MSHTFYTRYFRLDTTLALVAMKVWFVLPFVATLEHNCSNVTFACCSSCVWDCVATRHVTFDNFDQVFRCLYGRCLGYHIHLHCHWRIYRALFAATRRENAVSACRCSILQQKEDDIFSTTNARVIVLDYASQLQSHRFTLVRAFLVEEVVV